MTYYLWLLEQTLISRTPASDLLTEVASQLKVTSFFRTMDIFEQKD